MKDPAFLFYPNDYLGGTMGMTFEEKGAYIELLMLQFNRGHMTSHMIAQTVGQLWDTVKDKFIKDESGLFYNVRLEDEQNKRKLFTDSRKNNKLGTNQHTKKGGHMSSHMEDENEDINMLYEDTIKKGENYSFEEFWNDYDKKIDSKKCQAKWSKISESDRMSIKAYLPEYKKSTPDIQYRKNPATFLNNSCWNDSIIYQKNSDTPDKLGYNESYIDGKRMYNRCIEIPKGTRPCPNNLWHWNATKKDWSFN